MNRYNIDLGRPAPARTDHHALVVAALRAAVNALEHRAPVAIARPNELGPGWSIQVLEPNEDEGLLLSLPDWDRFHPMSAGACLIEHGWTPSSSAHSVPERYAGWARHTLHNPSTLPVLVDVPEAWTTPVFPATEEEQA